METPLVSVVEDDAGTRESFAALFMSRGLEVEVYASGEEFCERFSNAMPGCVVTDFRLGGMNGVELNERLVQGGCLLPVVLISGYLDVRTATEALGNGIFRVIEKPYHDDELLDAVEDAIRWERETRTHRVRRLEMAQRLRSLDLRERLTLEMIVAGHGNRAIERKLGLSTRTVDRIRRSILEKTDYLSFVELSAAYGAARANDDGLPPLTTTGINDLPPTDRLPGDTIECLHAGLQRLRAVLGTEDEIVEDLRPLLRDTEAVLLKALGTARVPMPPNHHSPRRDDGCASDS